MIARMRSLSKGPSLLELLSLATIIGIIVVSLVPFFGDAQERELELLDRQQKSAINAAVEKWYIATGAWPSEDLSEIGQDPRYFPAGLPTNPITGRAYTLHCESKTVR